MPLCVALGLRLLRDHQRERPGARLSALSRSYVTKISGRERLTVLASMPYRFFYI